jgi:crotonobetainyl-CoA:carnitine CoA-transferase CaiB-like acyl-CoA transferase
VANGPRLWVSITAYGRRGASGARVGFGDDAAAAGGLVAWSRDEPVFCSDAVADPLTGLTAAARALQALQDGGRWLLDVAMAGVAASCAGPTLPVPEKLEPAPPSARQPVATAPAFGADTAAVLAELGLDG